MSDITTDAITSKIVTENKRIAFLPRKIPKHYLQFESLVYRFADNMIKGYSGGYWEFIELSNDGFYLKPSLGSNKVKIQIDSNGYSGQVSEDAAGIIVTIFSLNLLVCKLQEENIYQHYESLIDYTYFHEERQQIRAAVD